MVRKTKSTTSACPSSKTDANSETSSENETEKKTLIFLSFPLVLLFNLIKTILFELFIVLKFVYNSSSRLLNKPATVNHEEVNLEVVKADENKGTEMDLLQQQKFHHKKAFEYISQALKIDETQNEGKVVLCMSDYDFYGSSEKSICDVIRVMRTCLKEIVKVSLTFFQPESHHQ